MAQTRRSLLGLITAAPLAAGVLAATPASAAASSGRHVPADLRPGGAYDRLAAALAAEDRFSGTVLLAHRGRPVLARAHGKAHKAAGTANTVDTVFCLGSITKIFTAVAIAQLAERGSLSFHDRLSTYLDGFPPEVTLHQLLTHTSGLGRPPLGHGEPPGLEWDTFDEVMDGTVDLVRNTPPQFTPPGIRHVYSNDGYFLLGAVVARVSGRSYFDYVRENVFAAAGMTRTAFHSAPEVRAGKGIARPYATQPDGTRFDFSESPYFPFSYGPAGGAYSTAPDMLRFACALSSHELLGESFTGLLTGGKVPLAPADGPADPLASVSFYGYGHRDSVVNGRRVHGHSGSAPGASARLDLFPEREYVSVVLSNYDGAVNPLVEKSRELITR
ncbi:serine hydrolase domain-containing protein [Phytomonospora endophytica]|uniref:CubicO group peptidase (Beta-lactamase class C family) n=1 Tax=Phytomonospora endophytica TaxID=714109 RepID=A0A841FTG1_9ACTN|nr:serine hydrolase domain-containing protein [Phytomonospora endophytica]MBB6039605.1 CubicO group peptidase (beta-lactamase class C family) [Phytomonospora endophytica]GIG65677.1 serine hydrolase [Phytomonospora endophytica]